MEKMTVTADLARDTRGSNFVERILLVALVALALIGAWTSFGSKVRQKVLDQAVMIRDVL